MKTLAVLLLMVIVTVSLITLVTTTLADALGIQDGYSEQHLWMGNPHKTSSAKSRLQEKESILSMYIDEENNVVIY